MQQPAPETLDLRALERFVLTALVELRTAEGTLNSLNVYPVPDGDTGTNVYATWSAFFPDSAAEQSGAEASSDEESIRAAVTRMTAAARGNAGVILSEYVRGCAQLLRYEEGMLQPLDADRVARMLHSGAAAARRAVDQPVEGTILSVADAAASGAASARSPRGSSGRSIAPADVLDAAVEAATSALKRSPRQLPVLADAGVVDSGGAALLFLLEALARVAGGRHGLPRAKDRAWLDVAPGRGFAADQVCQVARGGPGFELMGVAHGLDDDGAQALRTSLAQCGDSVVVAGGEGTHRIHVHTDDVLGAASRVRALADFSAPTVTRFEGPLEALAALEVEVADSVLRAYVAALGCEQSAGASADGRYHLTDGVAEVKPERETLAGRSVVHVVATVEACAFESVLEDEPDFTEIAEDSSLLRVMTAQTWSQAQEFLTTQMDGAEHVVAIVDPEADRELAQAWLDEVVTACPDTVVLRLVCGGVAQLGVE